MKTDIFLGILTIIAALVAIITTAYSVGHNDGLSVNNVQTVQFIAPCEKDPKCTKLVAKTK